MATRKRGKVWIPNIECVAWQFAYGLASLGALVGTNIQRTREDPNVGDKRTISGTFPAKCPQGVLRQDALTGVVSFKPKLNGWNLGSPKLADPAPRRACALSPAWKQ